MRSIFVFCCLIVVTCKAQIQLNQVGFYPGATKIAIVTGNVAADNFYVVAHQTKDTVFRGKLGPQKRSAYSSTVTRLADFSSMKKGGRYFIVVPGVAPSYSFEISDLVHRKLALAALKGFYYQRSDMMLVQRYALKWHRVAGHPDTSVQIHASAADANRPAGTILSSPGGWYDAGDYNKYIVNSGITMGTLLSAYEDFTEYFDRLQVHIPENTDAIPDILNEVVYNLRWMLTMQDPADGGVYHKCTNAQFDGMVMPGVTKAPRYLVQKSTAAALNLAAVAAQSARVLKKYYPTLADSCLKTAIAAWNWALKNPDVVYNQRQINSRFDPDIGTGEYGDRSFDDERLWAAAELFITTSGKEYADAVAQRLKDRVDVPSWSSVAMLGYYTMVRHNKSAQMKDSILHLADKLIANIPSNAFAVVMGQSKADFVWGSNAVAANQGILLINAYRASNNKKYLNAALSNLDYILGRNATGYCFVTGYGTKSPMHPHHRPSVADGIAEPVPGLLAGGPNPGRQDKCNYPFTETETAYTDVSCSYASNEIAINWNAPLVYLANAIEASYKMLKN